MSLLAQTLPFLASNLWWYTVMDDLNLNEKPLGKWQQLQHCNYVTPLLHKKTRNDKYCGIDI